MKYRSEFKHGFTNPGYLHCAILKPLCGFKEKRALKSRDMQFFLQHIQNEIFKIFKMFKNNMKFTRAACWLNSKIISRDKNATLTIFLFCHSYWSFLWCHYWKSLSRTPTFQKNYLICVNESPLKMMKNPFYFTWKAFLISMIFKFLKILKKWLD